MSAARPSATAGRRAHIELGVDGGGDQLGLAQPGLGDRVERVEQLDDAAGMPTAAASSPDAAVISVSASSCLLASDASARSVRSSS